VALVHKRTGNLRACQLLLGHAKLESTVRPLGIEIDDALIRSEQTDPRQWLRRPEGTRPYAGLNLFALFDDEAGAAIQLVERDDLWRGEIAPE
jgi:hypothetical protein